MSGHQLMLLANEVISTATDYTEQSLGRSSIKMSDTFANIVAYHKVYLASQHEEEIAASMKALIDKLQFYAPQYSCFKQRVLNLVIEEGSDSVFNTAAAMA